jgi:hypothetical protein
MQDDKLLVVKSIYAIVLLATLSALSLEVAGVEMYLLVVYLSSSSHLSGLLNDELASPLGDPVSPKALSVPAGAFLGFQLLSIIFFD